MALILPNAALDGVRSKLDRSKHHFDDIHARIEATLRPKEHGKPIVPPHEFDSERKVLILRQTPSEPLDPILPLIVGDCVHNIRSALDHLVFQLAILNGSGSEAATKTSFPICLSRSEFKNAVKGHIRPFISGAAFAEIEKSQPYKTSDPPERAILWLLSQLDIIDKHRLLVVISHQRSPISFELTVPTGEKFSHELTEPKWKPATDGAEVIRFDLSDAIKGQGEVNVNVEMAATVNFLDTGLACDGGVVEDILQRCGGLAESIINNFGKLFFGE